MTFSLTIETARIISALKLASNVADGSIPILKSTLIRASRGSAQFTATNTAQTVTAKYEAHGDGEICIETAALLAKLNTLPSGSEVSLVADGAQVIVKSGRSKWKLPYLPAIDFPTSTADEIDAETVAVGPDFIAAVNAVIGGAETNIGVAHNGVRIDGNTAIATNGKQLRIAEFSMDAGSFTLPISVAKMIPAECEIRSSENAVSFSTQAMTVKTKLVEGTYPDWQRMLSVSQEKLTGHALVDRDEFIKALEAASAIKLSGEKAGSFVNMRLTFGERVDIFTRNHVESEEGSADCECERDGDESSVGVNGKFLIDSAKSLDCDTLKIAYGDQGAPLVLSPVAGDRANYRVIMPRRFT